MFIIIIFNQEIEISRKFKNCKSNHLQEYKQIINKMNSNLLKNEILIFFFKRTIESDSV